jgi:glycosyltransferase involved in cell wall biosynthesis
MEVASDQDFVIKARPPARVAGGIRFHLDQLYSAAWLFRDVIKTGAKDVVVMDGVTHFFLLAPLVWTGRRVFFSIHTVPWREHRKISKTQRLIRRLDGWFLRRCCSGCLAASPAIARELRALAGSEEFNVTLFTPLYDEADFEHFQSPNAVARPFRIYYAGRMEESKGIFDLLHCVDQLAASGYDVRLDYCGDGTALSSLREGIQEAGLTDLVAVHGHLDRPMLLQLLEQAQIVVVPTRSSFPEGLNQVVIEAVLARRPVITSSVCPALELVRAAAVEAEADSAGSYRAAIQKLIDQPDFFAEKVAAGASLRNEFFDPTNAWTARSYEMIVEKGG